MPSSTRFFRGSLVLQRRFKEGKVWMSRGRLGVWYGSGWPVRSVLGFLPATAAVPEGRAAPGAASHALRGRLDAEVVT